MKTMKLLKSKQFLALAGLSFALALIYGGVSYAASTAVPDHYVSMSERIGKVVILYRAFDVWIYFFQAMLLFLGIGYTIFYLIKFHQQKFITSIRKKIEVLTHTSDAQAAINFEMDSLSNRFLILDLMIGSAPIAGLLGTVVGLVQVFSIQSIVEHVTMQAIASGMYVAMVTTVCGLIVALVGMVGRHFLSMRLAELREILAGA